ncbi:ABC transporter permease [Companilactobacillus hulinensis]|uniref:ABC transporter permease n=1 Tax=Companilactobacillus hulinensis TaxID=2486007 RepID=UPI000F773875|nr:ABC transporter permease [Companilactobacillus hulinensis]
MIDKLLIAFKSIGKNKNRNFLTMLGIIIGIACVIAILAVGDGFTKTMTKGMGTHNDSGRVTISFETSSYDDSTSGFTQNDVSSIESLSGVDHVKLDSSSQEASAKVQYKTKHETTSLNKAPKHLNLYKGNDTTIYSDDSSNVFISHGLANRLFKGGNALNRAMIIDGNVFIVRGIYKISDFNYRPDIYVSKTVFKQLFAGQITKDLARIYVQPGVNKKSVGKRAVKQMKKFGEDKKMGSYSVSNPDQMSKTFTKMMNYITYFVALVAGISLLIAGIGVMNVMYITVSERRKEIGIRRAFGATSNDIRSQFLIESVVLCVIGGLVGIICGYGLVAIINAFLPFKAIVTVYSLLLSISVSTAVGLIFGFIPSNKAAQSPLVGLLKEE